MLQARSYCIPFGAYGVKLPHSIPDPSLFVEAKLLPSWLRWPPAVFCNEDVKINGFPSSDTCNEKCSFRRLGCSDIIHDPRTYQNRAPYRYRLYFVRVICRIGVAP